MALLDQTKKAWLNRYYPKHSTSQTCFYCGEELGKGFFTDFSLNNYCDKGCFLATKHFRDPRVLEIQKKIDRQSKNQLVSYNQRGR